MNSSVKKILVVDDDQDILTYLGNILRRANYEVISTAKGKEAVDLAVNQHPDLIILDIVLPDIGGSLVATTLTRDATTANIPIIFLTGILQKKAEESGVEKSGKHYVVAKPVTAEELLALVGKVLNE